MSLRAEQFGAMSIGRLIEHFADGIIGVQMLLMQLVGQMGEMDRFEFLLHLNDTDLRGEALWTFYRKESGLAAKPDGPPDTQAFIRAVKRMGSEKSVRERGGAPRFGGPPRRDRDMKIPGFGQGGRGGHRRR